MDHRIRLNVDAAELDDEPAELYALAHVVNVACGAHAGDERLAA
ncbi:MAG: LamB/YcsF family protein, partial [Myxococcales bacterium]|nr:LamB/YcsF family protein [Myxococcales bacterium]